MTDLEWNHYNERVMYVCDYDAVNDVSPIYVCRDGKFHSWLADEGGDGWVVHMVGCPGPYADIENMFDWLYEISQ